MSLLMSDCELRAIDGRRQEAVMRVLRQRHVAALLKEASPLGTPVPHRRGIGALTALASGWFGRRHPQVANPHPTRSTF